MPSHPSLVVLSRLLRRARRRLRVRAALRGAGIGAWVGVVLAAGSTAADAVLGWGLVGFGIGAAVAVGITAAGGLIGAALPVLSDRELALLLDRRLGTHEAFVTALHVSGGPAGRAQEVFAQLTQVLDQDPDPGSVLPLRLPRHLRFLPVAALLVPLGLLIPHQAEDAPAEPSALTAEGERLAQRVEELASEEAPALPPELTSEVEALAREMQAGDLSDEEARQRLADLQERVAQFEQSLGESADLLADLAEAARELDAGATGDLADALAQGDLGGAAEAAGALAEQLDQASPEERRRAAEALSRAGEELARSGDPALREAGEAMQDLAQDLREGASQGQPGSDSPSGADPSEGDPSGGPADSAERLSQELERARELAERLERDREALRKSQELNGALEAGRQRLGGEPSVPGGETSEQPGAGMADAQGLFGPGGPGDEHTWEDEGESEGGSNDGRDGQRQSDRTDGQEIDDFERFYAAVRMDDARFLLASEKGQLDPTGEADAIRIRRSNTDEQSTLPSVSLPADYARAASEAIRSEQVPAGYREAVKSYFDSME